jgi:hypothetical protein
MLAGGWRLTLNALPPSLPADTSMQTDTTLPHVTDIVTDTMATLNRVLQRNACWLQHLQPEKATRHVSVRAF